MPRSARVQSFIAVEKRLSRLIVVSHESCHPIDENDPPCQTPAPAVARSREETIGTPDSVTRVPYFRDALRRGRRRAEGAFLEPFFDRGVAGALAELAPFVRSSTI